MEVVVAVEVDLAGSAGVVETVVADVAVVVEIAVVGMAVPVAVVGAAAAAAAVGPLGRKGLGFRERT